MIVCQYDNNDIFTNEVQVIERTGYKLPYNKKKFFSEFWRNFTKQILYTLGTFTVALQTHTTNMIVSI